MVRLIVFSILAFMAAEVFLDSVARAGDEDRVIEQPKVEPAPPEPMPFPNEPEGPPLSVGEEESPQFEPIQETKPAAPAPRRRAPFEPDGNVDYSELSSRAEMGDPSRPVLPPALGFRGYRPNMVAAMAGDRTPGYGALVEYSWNRVGAGLLYAYRNVSDANLIASVQTLVGAYSLYRWLPFDVSPYFLLGLELGAQTDESFGGMAGVGAEGRIYSGWTVLLGYTYHSTMRRGFFGGGIGWSF